MGTYSIELDVTLEQEAAIKQLFTSKHWTYIRRGVDGDTGTTHLNAELYENQLQLKGNSQVDIAPPKVDIAPPKVKPLKNREEKFAFGEYRDKKNASREKQPTTDQKNNITKTNNADEKLCQNGAISTVKVQSRQNTGHLSYIGSVPYFSHPACTKATVINNKTTACATLTSVSKPDHSYKQPETKDISCSNSEPSSEDVALDKQKNSRRKQKITVREEINENNSDQSAPWQMVHVSLTEGKIKNKKKYLNKDYEIKGNVIKKENIIICAPIKSVANVSKNTESNITKTNPMVNKLVQTRSLFTSTLDRKFSGKELIASRFESNLSENSSSQNKKHSVDNGNSEKADLSSDAFKSLHKRGKQVQSKGAVINKDKRTESLNEKGSGEYLFASKGHGDANIPTCSADLHRKKLLEQTSRFNQVTYKTGKAVSCEPSFTLQSLLAITAAGHGQTSANTFLKERTLSEFSGTGSKTSGSQAFEDSVFSNEDTSALTFSKPRTNRIQQSMQTSEGIYARSLNDMKVFLPCPLTTGRRNKKKSLKNKITNNGASDKNLTLEKAVLSLLPKDIAANVRNQLKIRRTQSGPTSSRLMCPYCPNHGLVSPISFIKHLERHAKGDYICKACGKEFSCKRNLNAHMYKTRFGTSTIIACDLCDFQAKSKCMLKRHQDRAHVEQSFQCHICAKTFKTKSYFTVHLREAHEVIDTEVYRCNICGKVCRREAWLQRHMKLHKNNMDLDNKCTICNKQFKTRQNLIAHGKIHRERKYKCKICQKRFISNVKLEMHTKTHTGEKPFSCALCEYKSNQKGNIDKHMQRHERDEQRKAREESFKPRKHYEYSNTSREVSRSDKTACAALTTQAGIHSLAQSTSVASVECLVLSTSKNALPSMHRDVPYNLPSTVPSVESHQINTVNSYAIHENYKESEFNQYLQSLSFENPDDEDCEEEDGDEYGSDTEYTTDDGDDMVTTPPGGNNPSLSSFVSATSFSPTSCLPNNTDMVFAGQGVDQPTKYTAVPCSNGDLSGVVPNPNIDHLSTSDIIKQFGQQGDLDLDTEALLNFQKCARNVEHILKNTQYDMNQFHEQKAFSPYRVSSDVSKKDDDQHNSFQNDWNMYNTAGTPITGASVADNVDLSGLYQAVQEYADYANLFSNTNVTDSTWNIQAPYQDYYGGYFDYQTSDSFTADTGAQMNHTVQCQLNTAYTSLPTDPPEGCHVAGTDPDIGKMLTGSGILNTPEQTYMDLQTKSYQSRQSL
ncbi:uncharacterized protein LOC127830952 isoform X2 [Dreissena polymorpha]|uniref:uncharacterized protein LOC127830952 isoform X2 n=1 Tax=Dreissena polymorpha TaxID=45954 RepID=UPI002263CBA2|nr:uncharacterized protein LOC127830952 isoform X2 [Dreissena polymorpha]